MSVLLISMVFTFGCINLNVEQPENNMTGLGNDSGVSLLNPVFSIAYPSDGVILSSEEDSMNIDVLVQTVDITLTAPSEKNVNGEGHFLFKLDGEGDSSSKTAYTFENVPVGDHMLTVEFVNNDGSPYSPKLIESVEFTVKALNEEYVPKTYNLVLENGVFDSNNLTIHINDSVKFINMDSVPHTFDLGGLTNTGPLSNGKSYNYLFGESGTYTIVSMTNPNIKMTISVAE